MRRRLRIPLPLLSRKNSPISSAAAALHLASHGVNVVVLEAGEVGRGVMGARDVVEHAKIRAGDEREVHYSSTAGSAVLPGPVNCVKMAIRWATRARASCARTHRGPLGQ